MKTVGIIAEYNPFHKGHAYQLQKARELTGADYVVVVMSGNFVQRGFPAIADKYVRTEMALQCGADLVLELPVAYAAGSAESFAQGAVALLESLGCVDALCFGSECGDIDALMRCARLFEEEPDGYRQLLQNFLKQGLSFPAARSRAAAAYMHKTSWPQPCSDADMTGSAADTDAADPAGDADCFPDQNLLEQPNNILGIEYCRALLRRRSAIRPVTVRRVFAGYHDLSLDTQLASASAIRRALLEMPESTAANIALPKSTAANIALPEGSQSEGTMPGNDQNVIAPSAVRLPEKITAQLPAASRLLLNQVLEASGFLTFDDFSSILFYRLLSLTREELSSFQDISEDLAARMENCRYQFTTASAFADLLKTKQLTHTRITRALCHILLNLRQADLDTLRAQNYPVYSRVLGFRESALPLLSAIKQNGASPLLVKTADAFAILTPVQQHLFEQDVFAAHVYEAARACRFGTAFTHEYTRSPLQLP